MTNAKKMKNGSSPARVYGQDLMRGEHVVGENRLTWVAGDRPREELDETSRKNLAAGRKPGPRSINTQDPVLSIKGDDFTGLGAQQSGTSIFDPVLCELAYTWFTAPDAHILDPFAGGSVRGIVASYLGRRYTGVDLRAEQVEANEAQARAILSGDRREKYTRDPNAPTPVQRRGELWFKRDDLFEVGGVYGGKVRTCYALAQGAAGLVTAGSRQSPQANIVAQIARVMGIPCRVHTPTGELSPELLAARAAGAEVVQHKAGYNNVIIARAREDAAALGWANIPFGMECGEAVQATRAQAGNLPAEAQRLVIPVGSGMSLAGVLWGLRDAGLSIPVLGVVVGADPVKRLDTYAPPDWRDMVTLVPSGLDYHAHAEQDVIEGVALDPVYEAKCVPFLQPGDCLWIVGIRQTAKPSGERGKKDAPFPRWIVGNSLNVIPDEAFDFIFTCPPYYDLEVYSDDPEDLSNKDTYEGFLVDYRAIIAQAAARLRDDRFACVVVGDVRDKKGMYRNFVADTIAAFRDTGMGLYNEAILVTAVGSLSIRVGKQFTSGRKLGKTHQNVLVFVKGDPRKATAWCGPVEVGLLEGADEVGA